MTTASDSAHTDIFQFKQKVRVEVNNVLSSPVTIHCKSKDNDLGSHVINAHGLYSFGFNVNFIGTTLFFCGVSLQGKRVTFDVYKASRDQSRCPHFCEWHVDTNGVEGFKPSAKAPDIVIPWK
ncbi:S-protein homolog 6-like [Punica granatum]|nr:S-protein homolog 6-like [Punica granatum]